MTFNTNSKGRKFWLITLFSPSTFTSWLACYNSPLFFFITVEILPSKLGQKWMTTRKRTRGHAVGRQKRKLFSQFTTTTSEKLPWWLSGEESACQCRRHGFDPWSGKIPHAVEQLSQRATTIEPVLQSPGATITEPMCCHNWSPGTREPTLHNNKNHLKEVHTLQLESTPLLPC